MCSDLPRGRFGRHQPQLDVADFHRLVCGLDPAASVAFRRKSLRIKLIEEEAEELCWAIAHGDMPGAVKESCDLLVVTYGTMDEFGVDVAPFWDEVHASNMRKMGGLIRADGKAMKPKGWRAPNISGLLSRYERALEPRA